MRLVLLMIGAVVAQGRPAKFDEDDPQWNEDADEQFWLEKAHKAALHIDDNFAASYDARASALSQAASDRRRWRRAGSPPGWGRIDGIVKVPLTSSPGPGPDATPSGPSPEGDGRPRPHHRRHASRQATRQNWPFGGAGQEFVRRGDEFHWEAPFHLRRRRAAAADVVVACLGDSITKGADDLNYPLLMQRDELGDAWRVANYGVSGASLKRGETGVGKPYVDEAEYATFADDGADVVIILLRDKLTWAGRRRMCGGHWRFPYLGTDYPRQNTTRKR
ncbi:unnamed protein product [Pelagomonas calceolata]|uniref:SGNH hydrolase-type esterase domain-containing protein n=1 Tax=Pelagomonas calceolata TaxID=35677 RepID=A0A8J2SN19_9STRA|nr:unnamed protein product [Pelagomonas calceolata]